LTAPRAPWFKQTMKRSMDWFGAGVLFLVVSSCGADTRDVTVQAVVQGGACESYLVLQCACCGSGKTYCEQYVADIVASGEAVSTSTEAECAARKAEVKDVPAWCAATFTTSGALRTACQGFPPGTPGPSGSDLGGSSSRDATASSD
jgi:hypothetical protein